MDYKNNIEKSNKPDSFKRIMETASNLFSKKGYDATSVDEISEKANVNKALIYYYFKSKRKLLLYLFEEFTKKDVPEIIKKVTSFKKFNKEAYKTIVFNIFEEIVKYIDIIKILFIQGMGKSQDVDYLCESFQSIIDFINQEIKKYGIKIKKDNNTIYKMLLSLFIPLINFAVLYKENKISKKEEYLFFFVNYTYKLSYEFVEYI